MRANLNVAPVYIHPSHEIRYVQSGGFNHFFCEHCNGLWYDNDVDYDYLKFRRAQSCLKTRTSALATSSPGYSAMDDLDCNLEIVLIGAYERGSGIWWEKSVYVPTVAAALSSPEREAPKPKCVCDIRDLMSYGHKPGCGEAK